MNRILFSIILFTTTLNIFSISNNTYHLTFSNKEKSDLLFKYVRTEFPPNIYEKWYKEMESDDENIAIDAIRSLIATQDYQTLDPIFDFWKKPHSKRIEEELLIDMYLSAIFQSYTKSVYIKYKSENNRRLNEKLINFLITRFDPDKWKYLNQLSCYQIENKKYSAKCDNYTVDIIITK